MESEKMFQLVNKCFHLKFKFRGVFAADQFPILESQSFLIVNTDSSILPGSHWCLLCNKEDTIYYADPLGFAPENYSTLYQRLCQQYNKIYQIQRDKPVQTLNSQLCGLFCIYIAHAVFTTDTFQYVLYMNDDDLLRFALHML